ncbi:MAG: hypothetical protein RQ877_05705 [Vulcanisaeta sp.]|nr:hypothetical protein [Vulcanisaeta sp.]
MVWLVSLIQLIILSVRCLVLNHREFVKGVRSISGVYDVVVMLLRVVGRVTVELLK